MSIYRIKYENKYGLQEAFTITDNEFEATQFLIKDDSIEVDRLKDVLEITDKGILFTNTIRKSNKKQNGMSYFEELLQKVEQERENGRQIGRLWAKLDHLKTIVTKDLMKKYNWNDEYVMHLLDVDEVGYCVLLKKLDKLLREPQQLKKF